MEKNPELARPIGQFTEINGQLTRKPDSHTKRKGLLGKSHLIIEGKGKDKVVTNRFRDSEGQKPDISKRQHVFEGLSVPVNSQAEDSDIEEYKEQGEKVSNSDSDIDIKSSPFAQLLIPLYSEKDDLEPDALAEDSTEQVAANEAKITLDEKEEVWDYAYTRFDQES